MHRRLLDSLTTIFCLAPSILIAATLRVPSDFQTIEDAVNAANPGDTVLIEELLDAQETIIRTDRLIFSGPEKGLAGTGRLIFESAGGEIRNLLLNQVRLNQAEDSTLKITDCRIAEIEVINGGEVSFEGLTDIGLSVAIIGANRFDAKSSFFHNLEIQSVEDVLITSSLLSSTIIENTGQLAIHICHIQEGIVLNEIQSGIIEDSHLDGRAGGSGGCKLDISPIPGHPDICSHGQRGNGAPAIQIAGDSRLSVRHSRITGGPSGALVLNECDCEILPAASGCAILANNGAFVDITSCQMRAGPLALPSLDTQGSIICESDGVVFFVPAQDIWTIY